MLQLIYILAFTVLAFLAVGNLIRNIVTLGLESQRPQPHKGRFTPNASEDQPLSRSARVQSVPHPELLDDSGNVVNEPFLVMRSMTVEDARERLDALYKASPGHDDPGEAV